jgi:hypothetical protein
MLEVLLGYQASFQMGAMDDREVALALASKDVRLFWRVTKDSYFDPKFVDYVETIAEEGRQRPLSGSK